MNNYRRFPKTNSILTLGALVFAGAVLTTLAHAEETPRLRYLSAGALPETSPPPSRHHWLLPEGVAGRLEIGDYRMRFPARPADQLVDEPQPVQLRVRLGSRERSEAFLRGASGRALMSDSEREQQRLNGPWFSMSVSRSW